jgi:cytidylate kinase
MSAIAIFSGTFCQKGQIIQKVIDKTGFNLLTDQDLIEQASGISGISEKKVSRALTDKVSVFNAFTHEKEQTLAYLKLALAKTLSEKDNIIIEGFVGLLVPQDVSHVLRICLIADMKYRLSQASQEQKLNEKDALALIHKEDTLRSYWVNSLYKIRDPWNPSLYDMVIPIDKTPLDDIVTMINENLKSEVIMATEASNKAAADFQLGANVEVLLAKEGHIAEVSARDGAITLTINKNVLMLGRLEEELKKIVGQVSGVKTVDTRIGKGFYQADIYRKYDFEMPSKVLLVDDERDFVQTLSERAHTGYWFRGSL